MSNPYKVSSFSPIFFDEEEPLFKYKPNEVTPRRLKIGYTQLKRLIECLTGEGLSKNTASAVTTELTPILQEELGGMETLGGDHSAAVDPDKGSVLAVKSEPVGKYWQFSAILWIYIQYDGRYLYAENRSGGETTYASPYLFVELNSNLTVSDGDEKEARAKRVAHEARPGGEAGALQIEVSELDENAQRWDGTSDRTMHVRFRSDRPAPAYIEVMGNPEGAQRVGYLDWVVDLKSLEATPSILVVHGTGDFDPVDSVQVTSASADTYGPTWEFLEAYRLARGTTQLQRDDSIKRAMAFFADLDFLSNWNEMRAMSDTQLKKHVYEPFDWTSKSYPFQSELKSTGVHAAVALADDVLGPRIVERSKAAKASQPKLDAISAEHQMTILRTTRLIEGIRNRNFGPGRGLQAKNTNRLFSLAVMLFASGQLQDPSSDPSGAFNFAPNSAGFLMLVELAFAAADCDELSDPQQAELEMTWGMTRRSLLDAAECFGEVMIEDRSIRQWETYRPPIKSERGWTRLEVSGSIQRTLSGSKDLEWRWNNWLSLALRDDNLGS